jgi:hypothetical protein
MKLTDGNWLIAPGVTPHHPVEAYYVLTDGEAFIVTTPTRHLRQRSDTETQVRVPDSSGQNDFTLTVRRGGTCLGFTADNPRRRPWQLHLVSQTRTPSLSGGTAVPENLRVLLTPAAGASSLDVFL